MCARVYRVKNFNFSNIRICMDLYIKFALNMGLDTKITLGN